MKMTEVTRPPKAHKSKLRSFIYKLHHFVKAHRLKRRLSKISITSGNGQSYSNKHASMQSTATTPIEQDKQAPAKLEDKDVYYDADAEIAAPRPPLFTSPPRLDSLKLMPDLSTPSSSRRWRAGVMQSLHLSSPSMPLIGGTPQRNGVAQKRQLSQPTPSTSLIRLASTTSDRQRSHQLPSAVIAITSSQLAGERGDQRPSEQPPPKLKDDHVLQNTVVEQSFPPSTSMPHLDAMGMSLANKTDVIELPSINERSRYRNQTQLNLSQASSVHLPRMGISRLLRTTSIFSSPAASGGEESDGSLLGRWNQSASKFGSEDMPAAWGQVLDHNQNTGSSSVYSSSQASPALFPSSDSNIARDLPSLDLVVSGSTFGIGIDGTVDDREPLSPLHEMSSSHLPSVPSTSSLGKESKFKEELNVSTEPTDNQAQMVGLVEAAKHNVKEGKLPLFSRLHSVDRIVQPNTAHTASSATYGSEVLDDSSKVRVSNRCEVQRQLLKPVVSAVHICRDVQESHVPDDLVLAVQQHRQSITSNEPSSVIPAFLNVLSDLRNSRERRESNISLTHRGSEQKKFEASQAADQTRNTQLAVDRIMRLDTITSSEARKSSAAGLLAKAIEATETERSAFLLPQHKDQARIARIRPRSASYCPPMGSKHADNDGLAITASGPIRQHSDPYLTRPSAATEHYDDFHVKFRSTFIRCSDERLKVPAPKSERKRVSFEVQVPDSLSQQGARQQSHESTGLDLAPVGAWGRYPSHTRPHRSGSAGAGDSIIARDFAYEIDPELIDDSPQKNDDAGISSPKNARLGLQKSSPIRRAREILRNYKLFLGSPNIDYLRYGHGRRTSVNQGGELLYDADLEVIPDITIPCPRAGAPFAAQEFVASNDITPFDARRKRQQSFAVSVADSMLSPGTSVHQKAYSSGTLPSEMDGAGQGPRQIMVTFTEPASPRPAHAKNESIMSIRQSSYDLLQKLQESEATERQKALSE